jgi:hypothetical protein
MDVYRQSIRLGISPSCDRICQMCALVEEIDTVKRLNMLLESGEGAIGAWLPVGRHSPASRVSANVCGVRVP